MEDKESVAVWLCRTRRKERELVRNPNPARDYGASQLLIFYLVIADLDAEAGEEVHKMIAEGQSLFVRTDIGDENSVKNLFERGNNSINLRDE